MTAADAAAFLGGTLVGDGSIVLRGVAKIEEAGPADLSFIANVKYTKYLHTTTAGAVLIAPGAYDRARCTRTLIEVPDPYFAFLKMLERFHPRQTWLHPGIDPSAVISPEAVLAEGVTIGAFVFVGPCTRIGRGTVLHPHVVVAANVVIGENCEIHSHVSLREGVRLGNRVIIQNGAVIGGDGFGFAPCGEGYQKIPQMGTVVIQDDVEIGANTTLDRATLGETVIGKGTKLDNLIQIGHNVTIGSHTVIAAQTGVSGSVRIGDRCRIGGQVGLVGHLNIGDEVMIAAQSGIAHDVATGEAFAGSPARPLNLWKRVEASLSRLPELLRRVRDIETAVFGKGAERKMPK
ncbi:UDP-3-O-(3-hydroxymyristoyl)glucosamine N-acyltransferase [bacterium]|nr:UDP-3-O-(3-hydroxymyristoyl)glucosamine N-acyltransferase [bacterium]